MKTYLVCSHEGNECVYIFSSSPKHTVNPSLLHINCLQCFVTLFHIYFCYVLKLRTFTRCFVDVVVVVFVLFKNKKKKALPPAPRFRSSGACPRPRPVARSRDFPLEAGARVREPRAALSLHPERNAWSAAPPTAPLQPNR